MAFVLNRAIQLASKTPLNPIIFSMTNDLLLVAISAIMNSSLQISYKLPTQVLHLV